MRIFLLLALMLCPFVAKSWAETRTYQLVENEERFFTYGGGLAGVQVSAKLRGTFDVNIEEDGLASISRFNVSLYDVLNGQDYDFGWQDGDRLADRLLNPALELEGAISQSEGLDHIYLSVKDPWEEKGIYHRTNLQLKHLSSDLASMRISSTYFSVHLEGNLITGESYLAEQVAIDYPAMYTKGYKFIPTEPQLLVRLVPEPSSITCLGSGLLALTFIGNIHRRRQRGTELKKTSGD